MKNDEFVYSIVIGMCIIGLVLCFPITALFALGIFVFVTFSFLVGAAVLTMFKFIKERYFKTSTIDPS